MSTLDPTAKAIANLSNLFVKDTRLTQVLSTPRLSPEDKSAIVAELNKHMGAHVATVKNFLETLAENNRLGHLQAVCEKFDELMSAARGEVEMTITSAERLDNKTLSRLEIAVSKSSYIGQGKTLKVANKVCPASRKHGLRFSPNVTHLDTGRPRNYWRTPCHGQRPNH